MPECPGCRHETSDGLHFEEAVIEESVNGRKLVRLATNRSPATFQPVWLGDLSISTCKLERSSRSQSRPLDCGWVTNYTCHKIHAPQWPTFHLVKLSSSLGFFSSNTCFFSIPNARLMNWALLDASLFLLSALCFSGLCHSGLIFVQARRVRLVIVS